MGQSRRTWTIVVVGGLLLSCGRSPDQVPDAQTVQYTNQVLSSRGLPVLPDGARDVRCWTGGIFAKYMNVKFTVSPDRALDYLRKAGAPYYYEFQIEGKEYRILATHSFTAASRPPNEPFGLSWLVEKRMSVVSWFKSVFDIRHGWYYYFESGNEPVGYYVYYDVDNQQFYVYWTYS